jgi:hypothetical protein
MKYYTVEKENDIVIYFCKNKFVALIKCIFNKECKKVFQYENDEVMGCIFSK